MQRVKNQRGVGTFDRPDERDRRIQRAAAAVGVEFDKGAQPIGGGEIAQAREGLDAPGLIGVFDGADDEMAPEPLRQRQNRAQGLDIHGGRDGEDADLKKLQPCLAHEAFDFRLFDGIASDGLIRRQKRVEPKPRMGEAGFSAGADLAGGTAVENGEGGEGDDLHGQALPRGKRRVQRGSYNLNSYKENNP